MNAHLTPSTLKSGPVSVEGSATVATLSQKAGVPQDQLRQLVLKELADNALDAGAQVEVGILPGIANGFFVEDDGPGIKGTPEEIGRHRCE